MLTVECPCCSSVPCHPECTFRLDAPEQFKDMIDFRAAIRAAEERGARWAIDYAIFPGLHAPVADADRNKLADRIVREAHELSDKGGE